MMWYWGGGVHWWGWLLGFLAMLVFWSLVVWVIWYFVTNVLWRHDRVQRSDEAQRILDARVARGEIDAEDYRRLRDLLRGRDERPPSRAAPRPPERAGAERP